MCCVVGVGMPLATLCATIWLNVVRCCVLPLQSVAGGRIGYVSGRQCRAGVGPLLVGKTHPLIPDVAALLQRLLLFAIARAVALVTVVACCASSVVVVVCRCGVLPRSVLHMEWSRSLW